MKIKVCDDDEGTIDVTVNGATVYSWMYGNEEERRTKVMQARYFCDGWCVRDDMEEEPEPCPLCSRMEDHVHEDL